MSYMKEWLSEHCVVCARELSADDVTHADGSLLNTCSHECHRKYVEGYVNAGDHRTPLSDINLPY